MGLKKVQRAHKPSSKSHKGHTQTHLVEDDAPVGNNPLSAGDVAENGSEENEFANLELPSSEDYDAAKREYEFNINQANNEDKTAQEKTKAAEARYKDRMKAWEEEIAPILRATDNLIREDVYDGLLELGYKRESEDSLKNDYDRNAVAAFTNPYIEEISFYKDGKVFVEGPLGIGLEEEYDSIAHFAEDRFSTKTLERREEDTAFFYPNDMTPPMVTLSKQTIDKVDSIRPINPTVAYFNQNSL